MRAASLWDNPRISRAILIAVVGATLLLSFSSLFLDNPGSALLRVIAGIGIALVLAGLAWTTALWAAHRRVAALARRGMVTRGTITAIDKDPFSPGYRLHYSFHDDRGRARSGVRLLEQQEAFTWREGQEGEVRYDAAASHWPLRVGDREAIHYFEESESPEETALPEAVSTRPRAANRAEALPVFTRPSTFALMRRSRPLGDACVAAPGSLLFGVVAVMMWLSRSPDEEWMVLAGVTLFAVLGWGYIAMMVWTGLREISEQRRLLEIGQPTGATVKLIREETFTVKGFSWRLGWEITYRYDDAAGQEHYGRSGYLSKREGRRWRTRDKGVVIYDPARPDQNVWAGKDH
jgi:protein-S-isoprenylcysteine O-methyltransferase Ste14